MNLLQINSVVNSGSTGRIAEDIGIAAMNAGHGSIIAAANTIRPSRSEVIQIGNLPDRYLHGLKTRLFDRHGFGSKKVTQRLIKQIIKINPDIIHLHNIHGYYLNIEVLFSYLKQVQKPTVWTFHDCWPFTGHCSHFEGVGCYKWQTECNHCPNLKGYPASWGIDNSKSNFYRKKELFNGLKQLTIVTPSQWLADHVKNSFLKEYPVRVINNGIDLNVFKPSENMDIKDKYGLANKRLILGVANTWKKRKALFDFVELRKKLDNQSQIMLVGVESNIAKTLPEDIIALSRTESIHELAALYSAADVFVNPTYADTFPTTNLESLACGTPVITYKTGGSPETIDKNTGRVVGKGDIDGFARAIKEVVQKDKHSFSEACRERAEKYFNKDDRYLDYLHLYEEAFEKR